MLVLVFLLIPASAHEQRGFHTRFFFSVFGGRSYWTEQQPAIEALGTSDGWTCRATAIELLEPPRQPGNANQTASRTASVTCTDVSGASASAGASATISASCNVGAAERSSSSVQLKSARNQKGLPLAVHVECVTETR